MTASTSALQLRNSQQAPFLTVRRIRRAIVATAFVVAALACLFGSHVLREVEAHTASLLIGWRFASDAMYTTVSGAPGVAFNVAGDWLSLPITTDVTGTYALAGTLILAATIVILTPVSLTRVTVAFVFSALTVAVVTQARLLMLATTWGFSGTDAYYEAKSWSIVAGIAVGLLATAAAYAILTRPRPRRGARTVASP
ncbi:hypothetical protein [Microbacterium testaceum]|uniref:hypothetical protein n=1 Tax=Microbacterium testaceum TaxID=2033 RepID=UPI002AC48B61|nr:hypothetical protein [Microbacterium testaceum]MDZ5145665.1 hypothetical protein [Microbacterium testaceum]